MVHTMVARTETGVDEKLSALKASFAEMRHVIVAYSGGVDSTFLAAVANEVLGSASLAVTARSPSLARSELEGAVQVAGLLGLNHRVIETAEVERDDYRINDPNRCFFCKEELYTHLYRKRGTRRSSMRTTWTTPETSGPASTLRRSGVCAAHWSRWV